MGLLSAALQSQAGLCVTVQYPASFIVQCHPRIDKVVKAEVWILWKSELCKQLLCEVIMESCEDVFCALGLTC